jgi:hypothetical protein
VTVAAGVDVTVGAGAGVAGTKVVVSHGEPCPAATAVRKQTTAILVITSKVFVTSTQTIQRLRPTAEAKTA